MKRISYGFLGGEVGVGVGEGAWFGEKLFSGVCSVPCTLSPAIVLLIPITVFGVKLWDGVWPLKFSDLAWPAGVNGFSGVCSVRVNRTIGVGFGMFEFGLFGGFFI